MGLISHPTNYGNDDSDTNKDNNDVNTARESLVSSSNDSRQRNNRNMPIQMTESDNNTDLFQWKFIDPSKAGTCGFNKCFFRSHRNYVPPAISRNKGHSSSSSPATKNEVQKYFDFGFLVAYRQKKCNLTLGWEMANHLERTYGLQHLYDSPPETIPVTPRLVNFTQNELLPKVKNKFYVKISIEEFNRRLQGDKLSIDPSQHPDPTFQVQRVRIPKRRPVLEWGDNRHRNRKCRNEFPKFLSSISNKAAFSQKLLREIETLHKVLKKEPWIMKDFQVLVDQMGNIFHIDLDRKPVELPFSARKLEDKQKFAMNALKVISFKVLAAAETNDFNISNEDLSHYREDAERFGKLIC
jgi:hypothetical protein